MKSWEVDDEIRKNPALTAAIESFRPTVEEIVGSSAYAVHARWSLGQPLDGRSNLRLNFSDWKTPDGVETSFAVGELVPNFDSRWRVSRLVGDLLQIRSHKMLDELRLAEVA